MNDAELSTWAGLDDGVIKEKLRELARQHGEVLSIAQITYDVPPKKSFLIAFVNKKHAVNAAAALGGTMLGTNMVVMDVKQRRRSRRDPGESSEVNNHGIANRA